MARATTDRKPQAPTLGWALRRAALGLLMLFAMVTVVAWLFWAGIEPDDAAAADGTGAAQEAAPQR